jgi:hypothetical protein
MLVVSACATTAQDVSLLDTSGCELPCWNNFVVGQTTQDEILQFLKTSSDIDPNSIQNDNRPWKIFDNHIFFAFDQGGFLNRHPERNVEIRVSNNIVTNIIICGELHTAMSDIVEQIGEPEYIISGDNLDGHRNVILINPASGVSYWYTTDPSLGELAYELTSEVGIKCLDLFDPSLYEEMMEVGLFSMGHYNAEETLRVMYPWDGYGNLEEKYPPQP